VPARPGSHQRTESLGPRIETAQAQPPCNALELGTFTPGS
jgi:hypothetical protein